MPTPSEGGSGFRDRESAEGGADNVPDTRGVPSHGAEPEQRGSGTARARVGTGGGLGIGIWLVIAVAVLIALLYAGGVFR